MANNQLDLGKVTPVEGEDLSVLEHVTYNSEKDQLDSDKPLVETMNGYSITTFQSDITWTPIYIGACKNGNKLTVVVFGSFVYASGFDDSSRIAYINIPSAVANKLYPFTLEGKENVLASATLELTTGLKDSEKIYYEIAKGENLLDVILRGVNSENLTIGRTYLFRIEQTFLLSDNLISNE